MGIEGLLPVLKDIQVPVDLSLLSGESVAVDAYVWLHKGAFSCAFELATGKPTLKYVDYCMRKVNQLKQNSIWPIIVFDGGKLPMKNSTEAERHQNRTDRMRKGKEMLERGDFANALKHFQTSIDITPEMAYEWIKVLKKEGVEYVVAPYEADAQLAYLSKQGIVSAVISEDSDLLVFGCNRVIYKLGTDGRGIEINLENFGNVKGMEFWDHSRFRQMCILAGCDYLKSPPGIGVKTAMKYLSKCDAYSLIKSWVNWGVAVKAPILPKNYRDDFELAELTFKHQRVYDSRSKCLVPLTPFPDTLLLTDSISTSIGADLEPEIAQGIAEGNLNPITYKRFEKHSPLVVSNKSTNQIPNYTKKFDEHHSFFHNQIFTAMKRKQSDVRNIFPLTTKIPTNNTKDSDKKVKLKLASIQKLKPLTNVGDAKEGLKLKPASKPLTQMKFTYFKGSRLSDFSKPKVSPYFNTKK